jgi:hypothetical protein
VKLIGDSLHRGFPDGRQAGGFVKAPVHGGEVASTDVRAVEWVEPKHPCSRSQGERGTHFEV